MELLKLAFEYWNKIDDKIRFLFIGALNAGISYLIFAVLFFILGEGFDQICIAGQWILSSPISYLNQKFFVFNTRGNYLKEYLKCCSTWIVSYFLNAVIYKILSTYLIKNGYVVQFISLFVVSVVTYVLFKYFAFRSKPKSN